MYEFYVTCQQNRRMKAKKRSIPIEINRTLVHKIDGQFILMNILSFSRYLKDLTINRRIDIIQNHHTWKPNYDNFNGDDHFDDLKAMDRYHEKSRGFSDVAQNITIFPDGIIGICRPLNIVPAGIRGANSHGICIEHYGNFDEGGDIMTEAQKDSIISVNSLLCKKFNLEPSTKTIVYHTWYASKSCPGTNFFGGNSKEMAEANFIPLIKAKL